MIAEVSGNQPAWATPTYDPAGNMTSGPKAGSLADGATTMTCTYDAWNRMAAESAGTGTTTYQYNGLHHRIAKIRPAGGGTWDRTDYYYNEAWQVLEERKAVGVSAENRETPAATVYAQYAWDIRYIDAPIVRWRDRNLDGATRSAARTFLTARPMPRPSRRPSPQTTRPAIRRCPG